MLFQDEIIKKNVIRNIYYNYLLFRKNITYFFLFRGLRRHELMGALNSKLQKKWYLGKNNDSHSF